MKSDLVIKRRFSPSVRVRRAENGDVIWCYERDEGKRGMTNHIHTCLFDNEADKITAIKSDHLCRNIMTSHQVERIIRWFLS